MTDKKKRNDMILIVTVLLIAAVSFIVMSASFIFKRVSGSGGDSGLRLEIAVNSEPVLDEPLDSFEDQFVYEVTTPDGGNNTFIISEDESGNMSVRCSEADCPDNVCVETGTITHADEIIVCLPHRVTARLYEAG